MEVEFWTLSTVCFSVLANITLTWCGYTSLEVRKPVWIVANLFSVLHDVGLSSPVLSLYMSYVNSFTNNCLANNYLLHYAVLFAGNASLASSAVRRLWDLFLNPYKCMVSLQCQHQDKLSQWEISKWLLAEVVLYFFTVLQSS